MKKPLVSIITPFYNRGKTINETVDSVLNQTFQNFEYIIVNDGSTDDYSNKIFDQINDLKIQKITQKNAGVAEARNNGIKKAKGKYILCLDSDDIIAPTYIEKAILILELNPGIDIVYSDMQIFGVENRVYREPEFSPEILYEANIIPTAAVFRKSAWEKAGGYKSEIGFEDWEFWINLVKNGSVAKKIPELLFWWRRALESRCTNDAKNEKDHILKIRELHPNYLKKIKNCKHDQ